MTDYKPAIGFVIAITVIALAGYFLVIIPSEIEGDVIKELDCKGLEAYIVDDENTNSWKDKAIRTWFELGCMK